MVVGGLYSYALDRVLDAWIDVEFTTDRRAVTDYAVVLLVEDGGQFETVRVYDGTHGQNELHRYTRRGGKRAAEVFSHDTLGAGMRTAITEIKHGYAEMIESWHRH
jgi:hypothetical protein